MNSAFRRLVSGQIPATTGIRNPSILRRNSSSSFRSNTGCVIAELRTRLDLVRKPPHLVLNVLTPGFAATEIVNPVDPPIGFLPISIP